MFKADDVDNFRESLYKLLREYDANQTMKFMLILSENESNREVTHIVYNDNCGTCAAIMVDLACNAVIDGVKNGTLSVHAMPEMYGNSTAIN